MSKYVTTRKDVCAGQLLQSMELAYKIFDENDVEMNQQKLEERGIINFSVSNAIICRGMLFSVNDNGLANDLIYTTPTNYPIEGIQPKINVDSEFMINRYVELEELLKYLKYGVDLTQRDLNEIFRKLITHDWWLNHNRELFGWQKCGIGYSNTGVSTIPMSIYDNLSSISCCQNGKPYRGEPNYRLIRKRR